MADRARGTHIPRVRDTSRAVGRAHSHVPDFSDHSETHMALLRAADRTAAERTVSFVAKAVLPVPVVGAGASAGGPPVLKALFADVAHDCGMAFVVVMHLSPDHTSSRRRTKKPFR